MGVIFHVVINFLLLLLAIMGYKNIDGEKFIVLIPAKNYFFMTIVINLIISIISLIFNLY